MGMRLIAIVACLRGRELTALVPRADRGRTSSFKLLEMIRNVPGITLLVRAQQRGVHKVKLKADLARTRTKLGFAVIEHGR